MREQLTQVVTAGSDLIRNLPVEIRRLDYALINRTVLADLGPVLKSLSPSDYSVSIILPTGTKIGQEVTIRSDGAIDLLDIARRLATSPSVEAFVRQSLSSGIADRVQTWTERMRDVVEEKAPLFGRVVDRLSSATVGPTSNRPFEHRVKIRFFEAKGDGWRPGDKDRLRVRHVGGVARIASQSATRPVVVQVLRPGHAALNIMLPPGATLRLTAPHDADRSAAANAEVDFGVGLVNDIMKLRLEGRLDELAAVMRSLRTAEINEFAEERQGAALVAVYALLRTADRELAVRAVHEMHARLPNSADMQVMRAEMAALRGDHQAALEGFLSVRAVGLPAFSYGLNYLVNRLRFYVQCGIKGEQVGSFGIKGTELTAARDALRFAQLYAVFTDFEQPTTTFTGLALDDPDDDWLERDAIDGLAGRELTLQAPVQALEAMPIHAAR